MEKIRSFVKFDVGRSSTLQTPIVSEPEPSLDSEPEPKQTGLQSYITAILLLLGYLILGILTFVLIGGILNKFLFSDVCPCINGGKCSEDRTNKCLCPHGFRGFRCEQRVCICMNGATCLQDECVCKPQFTGILCQTGICEHGGRWTKKNKCKCSKNFIGTFCEKGLCKQKGTWNRSRRSCDCPKEYIGLLCEKSFCSFPCINEGKCIEPDTCQCDKQISPSPDRRCERVSDPILVYREYQYPAALNNCETIHGTGLYIPTSDMELDEFSTYFKEVYTGDCGKAFIGYRRLLEKMWVSSSHPSRYFLAHFSEASSYWHVDVVDPFFPYLMISDSSMNHKITNIGYNGIESKGFACILCTNESGFNDMILSGQVQNVHDGSNKCKSARAALKFIIGKKEWEHAVSLTKSQKCSSTLIDGRLQMLYESYDEVPIHFYPYKLDLFESNLKHNCIALNLENFEYVPVSCEEQLCSICGRSKTYKTFS